jgi:hypothetical protein
LLALGAFPNECTLESDPDDPIGIGNAVFRDSRKSFLSLEPDRKQVAIEAKLFDVGTPHRHEVGTDFFDITLDPATPPVVNGLSIPLAGSIPELAAAALIGLHKATVRDETGTIDTTVGDPPAWGVAAGYSVIDDTLDLFVTEVVQPGRFTGAPMPRWVGSGALGNDGETAVLRTSDEFLGDGLIFWVANRGTELLEPNFPVHAVGLTYDPEPAASAVTSSLNELEFGGNGTVAVNVAAQTQLEDGTFAVTVAAGLGDVVTLNGQEIRLTIPRQDVRLPDFEWQAIWTPSGDSFVGIDDSPQFDGVAIVVGTRPVSGAFGDDDRSWIGLELNLVSSRTTTEQLFLAPRSGSLLTGEVFTSRRDAGYALLPGQSFAATGVTETGAGQARVQFINQVPALRFFFNERDEAVGQPDLLLQITPRIVHSLDQ